MKFKYKMTPLEFMKIVRGHYQEAKLPRYYHPKVRRGRSHSLAYIAEDLVAVFIAFNLKEDLEIYVDQPITVIGHKKRSYPDISIFKENKLTNIIDVKLDLGWIRDKLSEICEKNSISIKAIRNKEGKLKDGITGETKTISITEGCKYHILIVSGCNITEKKLEEQINQVIKYQSEVSCYVLSGKEHPNANIPDEEFWKKLEIYTEHFDRFFSNIFWHDTNQLAQSMLG
jgi:hypothetical protein